MFTNLRHSEARFFSLTKKEITSNLLLNPTEQNHTHFWSDRSLEHFFFLGWISSKRVSDSNWLMSFSFQGHSYSLEQILQSKMESKSTSVHCITLASFSPMLVIACASLSFRARNCSKSFPFTQHFTLSTLSFLLLLPQIPGIQRFQKPCTWGKYLLFKIISALEYHWRISHL